MRDTEGWNIFEVITPDKLTFRLAFKGDTLRIRKIGWIPVEEIAERKSPRENCASVIEIKNDFEY